MTYAEYIAYHKRGDAGVEERTIAALCRRFRLSEWDAFRLVYFYSMTYHIPSALSMLLDGERAVPNLKFRTDRRYVRCNGAFPKLLEGLVPEKHERLSATRSTSSAYDEVRSWFFFGRYAAFLFLECWGNVARPNWVDDIRFGWEPDENYTKGAVSIVGSIARQALDDFLDCARVDTQDNAFAIETSLCAVAKFEKGTRWDGFYTERMLQDAAGTKWKQIIYECAS